jgi:hypothetical protein
MRHNTVDSYFARDCEGNRTGPGRVDSQGFSPPFAHPCIRNFVSHRQLSGIDWRFMASKFIRMIEPTSAEDALGLPVSKAKTPFTFFIHREDSEPERVASRNRLAPTQPLSSSTSALARPTELEAVCLFRSRSKLNRSLATVVAIHCDFASRPANTLGDNQRRQQPGGRQIDGYRRTIDREKNQRGVREHLT